MAYEHRRIGRQKVRYNSTNDDNPLVYQLVVDGEKVTPTSATIAVYAPGNETAVLAATAMSGSNSLLTYELDTTTVADFPTDNGYRADIVVTYSSDTYDRHIIFDVVPYLLDIAIGFDQLVALDDSIQGMEHAGDGDFSALIDACRDVLQARIESKVIRDDALIENMILDNSRVATAARFYILAQIMLNKGDLERHEIYSTQFESLFGSVLSSIKYDTAQDGIEPDEVGGLVRTRLVM